MCGNVLEERNFLPESFKCVDFCYSQQNINFCLVGAYDLEGRYVIMSLNPLIRRALLGAATPFMVLGGAIAVAPAFAQNVIEEIVVTARKRAENLQDVPAAVSAFGAEELKERGIDTIEEVGRLTPNVAMTETNGLISGALLVFIRGIGNDPGFDQGVGIYVDDVYLNRTSGSLLDVYDVERIEILKGPQGNLYGRNTIGGAIKYVSREPSEDTRMHFEAKVGTDSLRKYRAGLSGPLGSSSIWGSFAVSKTEHEGYQTNRYNGNEYASPDILSARGTLVMQATDSLRLKLVADLMRDRSDPYVPNRVAVNLGGPAGLGAFGALLATANQFVPGAGFLAPGQTLDISLPSDVDSVNTAFIEGGFDEYFIDTNGLSLTATWDLSDTWSLKSITAIREMIRAAPFDFDGSDQVFINTLQEWDTEDFSQELQVNFSGGNINAVLGLYYLDGYYNNESLTVQTPFLRLLTSHVKTTYLDERPLESTSFYVNVDWDFNEQWQLSIGGRLTTDKKEINQVADVTLTNHVAAFVRIPGLEQAPLVLSPTGARIFPNLPFFNLFLPHRDEDGNIVGLGNMPSVVTYPENKIGNDEWDEFTPSARLSYKVSEDTLVYVGASTGFKSGGFTYTGRDFIAPVYEPEFVTTYSVGVKTTLLDGTMRLNFEAFLNEYEDKQFTVVALDPATTALVQVNDNVGEAESTGAEVELLWLPPVDGLAVSLNVGILDVEINELIDQIPGTGMLGNVADQNALGYAPELTAQARIQYTTKVGNIGSLTFGLDADYRDEMYTDSPIDLSDPFVSQVISESRTLTNAFVTLRSSDNRWRVSLEGKNLSDKRVLQSTFQVSNFIMGGYNRGRTWGLTFAYDTN